LYTVEPTIGPQFRKTRNLLPNSSKFRLRFFRLQFFLLCGIDFFLFQASRGFTWLREASREASYGSIRVRRGVSKGREDGRWPLALWAGHPFNDRKAVSGAARPVGVKVQGIVDPSDTLGSPWPPLAILPCLDP
jgi:hypothetical protein